MNFHKSSSRPWKALFCFLCRRRLIFPDLEAVDRACLTEEFETLASPSVSNLFLQSCYRAFIHTKFYFPIWCVQIGSARLKRETAHYRNRWNSQPRSTASIHLTFAFSSLCTSFLLGIMTLACSR